MSDQTTVTEQKPAKEWGSEITDSKLQAVLEWSDGEINLAKLMKLTGTNTSSVYSMIARAFRLAIEKGILKRVR